MTRRASVLVRVRAIKITAIQFNTILVSVNSLNVRRLRAGCRIEDGYHRCSLNGRCQRREDVFKVFCEKERVNCTDDEFACRGVNRCIPRMLLGTKNGCLLGKKGVITLPCGTDVKVNTLNVRRLRAGCRIEDGYHRCSLTGRCQRRDGVFKTYCEKERVNCTDDEFACRGINRCIPRMLLGTKQGCLLGKKGVITLPCRSDEFTCKHSRLCLPRWVVRDGNIDCKTTEVDDDSDEMASLDYCNETEFKCSNGRCIPREWVFDKMNDCKTGEDENEPFSSCNESAEFRCDNGQCVKRFRVKDGHPDCENGADERKNLTQCVTTTEFRCNDSGRCIPRSWVVDGVENCKDGSDEVIYWNQTCSSNEFRCHSGRRCIALKYLCDGMDHCGDCSDEIEGCNEARMWRCPHDPSICIPQSYACDGFRDCPAGKDNPQYLPGFECKKTVLGTKEEMCNIPQWTLYDNHTLCEDKSDLCFQNGSFNCARCVSDNKIIARRQMCDGVIDCTDLSDECLCNSNRNNTNLMKFCDSICYNAGNCENNCRTGELYCKEDKMCVNRFKICDGVIDCTISALDEKLCVQPEAEVGLKSNTTDFKCWKISDAILNVLKAFNLMEIYENIYATDGTKCDGVFDCPRFEDECNEECQMPECETFQLKNISPRESIIGAKVAMEVRTCIDYATTENRYDYTNFVFGRSICDGIQECNGGEDEQNCTENFKCDAGTVESPLGTRQRIAIKPTKVCDLHPDCLDQSDERNCSKLTHFYCKDGNPLYIPYSSVMNGKQDCDDNSDECPDNWNDENPLSSPEEMIKLPFLRHFIWFMACIAILGNIGVIIETYYSEIKSQSSSMSRCNRILIMNLAFSDFLMGVTLLVIGVKSVSMSGEYCLEDKKWRMSGLCNAIGVMTVLSSETSVFSLVALTVYRLYGIHRPFQSRHAKPKWAVVTAITTWALSIILALTPIIPSINQTTVTTALTRPSMYLENTVVSWDDFKTFAQRIVVLGARASHASNDFNTWGSAEDILKNTYADVAPEVLGYFGFYSADGVCIPRLFRIKGELPLHALSLFIISLNFCSLMFIIIAYCKIYHKSTHNEVVGSETTHENRSRAMQRKITILIATDLCCWLPICIMALASQLGAHISGDAYAVAAILLLPINSSLNPIIYSSGFSIARAALFNKTVEVRASIRRRITRKPSSVNIVTARDTGSTGVPTFSSTSMLSK
uniref:low-density lipoprotein receptor-related protein 2-like isoform X3 n=1 Tax=Styela clava TaxID=7725 RepID=UPI00193AC529|nr:low-density lipoprotein receptor-related protein 2-like isoform X3 [Styela clava]